MSIFSKKGQKSKERRVPFKDTAVSLAGRYINNVYNILANRRYS